MRQCGKILWPLFRPIGRPFLVKTMSIAVKRQSWHCGFWREGSPQIIELTRGPCEYVPSWAQVNVTKFRPPPHPSTHTRHHG